jgi:hypothetical protein
MNYNRFRTFVVAMTFLLSLAGYAGASTRSTAAPAAEGGRARLIIYRIPTIGRYVIVQVYVDNVMVGGIGFGGTYEGSLTPGRHVLSVLATPHEKWRERPPTVVDVRSGETYRFTAKGNNQGNLILRPVD